MPKFKFIKPLTAIFLVLSLFGCSNAGPNESGTTFVYPPWKHTWGVVKARPVHLRMFVGNKTKFDNPQGLACVRLDAWEDSTRDSDDDEVTVYGVNSGGNCIIYNRSMFAIGLYGLEPREERFDNPWGIAADNRGNVLVVDRGNSRVVHLRNINNDLKKVNIIGSVSDSAGCFIDPRGVALLPDGRFLVTDAALGRVTMFDSSGNVSAIWSDFIAPDGIAAVGATEKWSYYSNDEFVIVIDSMYQRVNKYDLSGSLVKRTLTTDWKIGKAQLSFVTIDYYNQVLITDKANGQIHKLDRNLNYINSFGQSGSGDYKFDQPRGIAIYRRFGQLFIAERPGAQYLWIGVDASRLETKVLVDSIWKDLRVDFFLTEPALADVDVYDSAGRFIARLMSNRYFPARENHFVWGLVVPQQLPGGNPLPPIPPGIKVGELLPNGRYEIRISFRATYSSRESFTIERKTTFGLTG